MPLSRLFGSKSSGDQNLVTLPSSLIESKSGKIITPKPFESSEISKPFPPGKYRSPPIPLVAVGGAATKILNVTLQRMKSYEISFKSAAIDLDWQLLDNLSDISHRLKLGVDGLGTSGQIWQGSSLSQKYSEDLKSFLSTYLSDFRQKKTHNVVFVLLSSGGTGTGVGLDVCSYLLKEGYRPVPLLILPDMEVSTRERFNGSVALYRLSFGSGNRSLGLTTILLDNQQFLESNALLPREKFYEFVNAKLGACLADLLVSTVIKSSGYSTDLDEFLEVLRNTRGIGTLYSAYSSNPEKELKELFIKNKDEGTSCDLDPLLSTRSYTLIVAGENTISAKSYRETFMEFHNSDIFHKLVVFNEFEGIKITGIYTGFKLSSRLREFMKEASDVRVKILNRTLDHELDGGAIQNIDKPRNGDKIEVMTDEEIRDQLAERASSKIRGELDD